MVRVKFVAVLIGTAGVGLAAGFTAICGLLGTLFGLGIQSSAVREVAAAAGRDDPAAIARVILTLRRVCWVTGLAGALAISVASPLLSQITFDSTQYAPDIAALGIVILLGNLAGGQMAVLQGTRRIGDMARANVLGGVASTLIAIAFYTSLGLRGIVPAMIFIAATQWLIAWGYARRLPLANAASMGWRETLSEARGMMRLGVVFMSSALMGSAVGYFTVTLIAQRLNLQAVGVYSAAFALSGVFVNFVLGAMGSDYYPRLTASIADKVACNRLINEQTEVGLLLAAPGLLTTMALAPWVVKIFYSSEFLPAVGMLQWFVLGCLGRVISWPLGYLMPAAGKSSWLFLSELGANLLHAALMTAGLMIFGLDGVAVAFVVLYSLHVPLTWLIARQLTGFKWLPATGKLISFMIVLHVMLLIVATHSPSHYALALTLPIAALGAIACVLGLKNRGALPWRRTPVRPTSG
jgi:antigen flippase